MKNEITALPSPEDLVKQIKEETVALSLRMKPSTKQYFDHLAAKDKSLSVNNLINRILDSYVTYYTNPIDTKSVIEQMRDYLESIAKNLSRLDDYDLLARIYSNQHVNIVNDLGNSLTYGSAELEMESVLTGNPSAFIGANIISPNSNSKHTVVFSIVCANHLPEGTNAASDRKRQVETNEFYYEQREVTAKYWAVVVAMMNSYLGKAKELLPGAAAVINRSLMNLLTDVVNNARNREDLIQMLVELFTDFLRRTVDE